MSFSKITEDDLNDAIVTLSTLKFWPSDPGVRAQIKLKLAEKVPHREALAWLCEQFSDRIGEWHGLAEMWGVLDTRYRPLDGRSYWSTLPGYTADDGEAVALLQLPEEKPLVGEPRAMILELLRGRSL